MVIITILGMTCIALEVCNVLCIITWIISCILSRCPVLLCHCLVCPQSALKCILWDMWGMHNWFSGCLADELATFAGMCSSGDQVLFCVALCIPSPGHLHFNALVQMGLRLIED